MAEGWLPATCTLPTAEQPLRLAEFDSLFRAALRKLERPARTRLVLTLEAVPGRAESVRDLIRRESECCSFFTFSLLERDGAVLLDVCVSAGHVDVLDAIAERAGRSMASESD
ncbi:MAG: hypothetical protein ABJB98_05840 [Actinomycetota bacterium]